MTPETDVVKRTPRFSSRKLTLTASLAGVYAVFRLVPLSRFIGIPGALSASGMVVPIMAVVLEPPYGILAILIGTVIGFVSPLNPVRFAGLDFLPGALNFVVASLVVRGRRIPAFALFLAVIVIFVSTPFTTVFVGSNLWSPPLPYFWLHLVALAVVLSPLTSGLEVRVRSDKYSAVALTVFVLAFSGTMIEHLTGGILTALFLGPGAVVFWPRIYLVYPIERLLIVFGAVLVATPVLKNAKIREWAFWRKLAGP